MCSPTAIQSLWPRSAEFGPWEGNRKALCKPHARDLPVWFLPHSKAPTSQCKGIQCVQRPAGSPRSLPSAGHLGFRRRESLHVAPVVTRRKRRHGPGKLPRSPLPHNCCPAQGGGGPAHAHHIPAACLPVPSAPEPSGQVGPPHTSPL